ncbi:MAG: glycosyltransferase [Cyclobacteriaceae bacterium]|nr:glycosyltransferase [Cyclobacteriaceae bacterium]
MYYTIIIPVYNRPEELRELLDSLCKQTFQSFEVLVIDDGSDQDAAEVAASFTDKLQIRYFYKKNSGPGPSRNYGCTLAGTGFFVFFDSDCIIPPSYFEHLHRQLEKNDIKAYGGPDQSSDDFTIIQRAISYSMTSVLTTGGIRGKKKSVEKFHPRSFNMGFSREVYLKTGGFSEMRFGEDIDLSIRIVKSGYKTWLLPECFVYHKRRTDYKKFFKQVFNSGIARINLYKRHPESLGLFHFFPATFLLYLIFGLPHALYHAQYFVLYPLGIYLMLIFLGALLQNKHIAIGFHAVVAGMVQLCGYGAGFLKGIWKRIILKQDEFHDFRKNFYG